MQKAVATEDEASLLPMRIGKQERSYRLRTTPMRDSEGRLLGTVTTLEDVTSLQDTDRFKTQFISVASRKLRDPLLLLRRGLYALAQGFGGELLPLQAELVASASNESEKLDDLMGDLIEVAELDAGRREFTLERLRPLQALNEARDRFCDDAAQKQIRVEVKAYADLSFVQADRRAMRSILDNLLSNAIALHAARRRDSAGRRRGQGLRPVHGARHRPRHRGRSAEHRLRPLQYILRAGLRSRPRAGPPAGRVVGRPDCRRKPPGPRNHLPLYSSRSGRAVKSVIPSRRVERMAEIKLERQQEPAKLRIYIGAAPGVGKTYDMLNDAYRMKHQQGIDVVIGLVETPRAQGNRGPHPRPGDCAPARNSLSRRQPERDGCGRHSRYAIRIPSSWMSWPTPMCPAARTASATKTCWSCWTPAST